MKHLQNILKHNIDSYFSYFEHFSKPLNWLYACLHLFTLGKNIKFHTKLCLKNVENLH